MKRASDDRTWTKMNEKKTKGCLWIISPNSSIVRCSGGNKFLLFWQSLRPGKTVSCAPDCKRGDTKISNQEEIVLRLGSKGCLCKLLKAKKHTFCCVYIHSNSREGKRSLIESTHVSFMHVWFHFLGGRTTVVERERERPSSSPCRHAPQTNRKRMTPVSPGITAKPACDTSDSHLWPDGALSEGPWSWSEFGGTYFPSWRLSWPTDPLGQRKNWFVSELSL